MSKSHCSGNTHTTSQMNHHANQGNPNHSGFKKSKKEVSENKSQLESEISKHIKSCLHHDLLNADELVPESYLISYSEGGSVTSYEKVRNKFVETHLDELIEAINSYSITYAEMLDDFPYEEN